MGGCCEKRDNGPKISDYQNKKTLIPSAGIANTEIPKLIEYIKAFLSESNLIIGSKDFCAD